MSKITKFFIRLFDWIENIAMVMYMFSTILVTVNVITRYIFKVTIFGNEELSSLVMLLMAFIAFPVVEARNQHLRVDVIDAVCKNDTFLKVVYIIRGIISLGVFGIISYYGIKVTNTAIKYSSGTQTLHIPKSIVFSVVVASFILAMVVWLVIFIFNKRRPLK